MIQAPETSGSPRQRKSTTVLLWTVFLVPLAAWMIQLFALYMLEDFISCTPGSQTPGLIMGIGVKPIALGITGILGLATLVTGILSFRFWKSTRENGSREEDLPAGRWLALGGMMQSILFTFIILIKVAPPLLLGVCEGPL